MWTAIVTSILSSDIVLAEKYPTVAEISNDSLVPKSLAQVTSVSQLSDVQPTDWAFQALQSLVEVTVALQAILIARTEETAP